LIGRQRHGSEVGIEDCLADESSDRLPILTVKLLQLEGPANAALTKHGDHSVVRILPLEAMSFIPSRRRNCFRLEGWQFNGFGISFLEEIDNVSCARTARRIGIASEEKDLANIRRLIRREELDQHAAKAEKVG
jgi:hypothetical protein